MPTTRVAGPPRHTRRSRWGLACLASVLALAPALLVAGPASAHPFVRGGELPVDSLATMTLVLGHGCGDEESDGGAPTTDVSLEVPAWLRIVEVPDEAGWAVELEEDDQGRVEVVTWTADGAEEPAPDFDLDVVATGEIGDERFLRVFQACEDSVYRWVGTPDEPADDPAIRVTLGQPDPEAPAPPEPQPDPAEDADPSTDATDATRDDPEPDPAEDAAPDAEESPDDDAVGEDAPPSDPVAVEGDDPGRPGWFVPVALAVLLAGIGALVLGRRGGHES